MCCYCWPADWSSLFSCFVLQIAQSGPFGHVSLWSDRFNLPEHNHWHLGAADTGKESTAAIPQMKNHTPIDSKCHIMMFKLLVTSVLLYLHNVYTVYLPSHQHFFKKQAARSKMGLCFVTYTSCYLQCDTWSGHALLPPDLIAVLCKLFAVCLRSERRGDS